VIISPRVVPLIPERISCMGSPWLQ
jgi:hypothetical protein